MPISPGVGAIGGATIGAVASGIGAKKARAASFKMQRRAHKFSKRRYRRRYQDTVRDMRKAGLNPILAATQGGGSPPSGTTASQMANVGEAVSQGAKAGVATAFEAAHIRNLDKQTMLLDIQVPRAKAMQQLDLKILSPLIERVDQFMNNWGPGTAKETATQGVPTNIQRDNKPPPTSAYGHKKSGSSGRRK